MKKMRFPLLALGLVLGGRSLAAIDAGAHTVRGQVVIVDQRASVLLLKADAAPGESSDRTFVIAPDTQLKKGKKSIAIGQLVAGVHVVVSYKTVDGREVATSVGIAR